MVAMPGAWRPAGRSATTGSPCQAIVPSSGWWAPASTLISVDLPAPFWPSRQCTSPARTSRSTPSRARTPGNVLTMPCISSSGVGGGVRPSVERHATTRLLLNPEHKSVQRELWPRHMQVKDRARVTEPQPAVRRADSAGSPGSGSRVAAPGDCTGAQGRGRPTSSSRYPSIAISAAPSRPDMSGAALTVISSAGRPAAASGRRPPRGCRPAAGPGLRHAAGHDDPVRVEEVDQAGQHGADRAAGVADQLERRPVTLRGELDHLPRSARPAARPRRASRSSAPPPAIASRQFSLPHRQTTGARPARRRRCARCRRRCPAHRGRPARPRRSRSRCRCPP